MIYAIDNRESNRITCLRALCAAMVVYLHQYAGDVGDAAFAASGTLPGSEVLRGVQYVISRIVTFSAVPLFFMLSSVLLYAKEFTWKDNVKKKARRLILPYGMWITLYILVYFLGQTLPFTRGFFENAGRKVGEMGVADFVGAYTGVGGHGLFVNAMWFLRDLIVLNLLAPAIKRAIDRFPLLILTLLAMLWNMGSIPEALILNRQSVVFFCLGYYVVKYGCRMKGIDALSGARMLGVYALAVAAEFYFYKTGSQLRTAAHSFSTIAGIALLIKLTGRMCADERAPALLRTIAGYSFFIYASHDFVQTAFKKLAERALPQTDAVQMAEYFLIPALVCGACILFAAILKRLVPALYDLLTGSRK